MDVQPYTEAAPPRGRVRAPEPAIETAIALLESLWLAPVGVAVLDRELRFVQVNAALARMGGREPDAHVGRTPVEVFGAASEVATRLQERMRAVLETGRPMSNTPFAHEASDGTRREWLASYYPVVSHSGEIRGVCALIADATEDRDRAAALERARESAERSARRLGMLQELSTALSAAHDPAAVGEIVIAHVRGLLGASAVAVRVLEGGSLRVIAEQGLPADAMARFASVPVDGEHPSALALQRNEALWLESPNVLSARHPVAADAMRASGHGAWAMLPLVVRERRLGSLGLVFPAARPFDLEERAFVLAVAEQCAQALDRALLFQSERQLRAAAQEATDRIARLQAVTSALSLARTVEDVAAVVVLQAHEAFGADTAAAYVTDPARGDLELVASLGLAPETRERFGRIALGARLPVSIAARTGQSFWFSSREDAVAEFPELARARLTGAFVAFPIHAGSDVLGALMFGFSEPRRCDRATRDLWQTVSQQCAQALERAQLFDAERAARAEAERARSLLDAIVENAPVGIGLFDRDLRFARVNPVLAEMNGLSANAHVGRTVRELLPGIPGDEVEAGLRRVLETGAPLIDVPLSGQTPAAPGRRRHWLETWYPVRSEGEVVGLGALVHEVTAEVEAQEFQRNVLGIVGHDLRNPLAAILTAVRLLQHGDDLNERQARLALRILTGVERMERIIGVLLDYARVRAGSGVPVHPRPCDLEQLCQAVVDEHEAAHPGREVTLRAEGDPFGEWDPDRVSQVLSNLLGNALDYSPAASPVELRWRGERDEVVIEVANQGLPIPEHVLPRLFEPFRRAERARPGGRDGLGLGLFIARAIVTAHRGCIEARSSEGEGTVFTVRLPRRSAARGE